MTDARLNTDRFIVQQFW